MLASIVIPTYRRTATLRRVLQELDAQAAEYAGTVDIRVTDDASGDGTAGFLAEFERTAKAPFQFAVHQKNRGPAAARNTALREAQGAILLITGDDIIPGEGFVRGHLDWHAAHPAEISAVLGRVTWPDELKATPFMRWMETGGRGNFFDFVGMQPGCKVAPESHFYTSNVSIKRSLFDKAGPFDESFPFASQEDLEEGYRLAKAGMELIYEPGLIGYHWHPLTVAGIIRRTYIHGYTAHQYWQKVPDRAGVLRRMARRGLTLLARTSLSGWTWRLLCRRCTETAGGPRLWFPALAISYWTGLSDARRGLPVRQMPVH